MTSEEPDGAEKWSLSPGASLQNEVFWWLCRHIVIAGNIRHNNGTGTDTEQPGKIVLQNKLNKLPHLSLNGVLNLIPNCKHGCK